MKWTIHGERLVYDNPWLRVALTDVELPGGPRFEHHVVRATAHAAGVVVNNPDDGVLLLWRHRFATDSWGWEIPAGRIDPGETAIEAAAREVLEETGWRPGPLQPVGGYFPQSVSCDVRYNLFSASTATYVGEPTDPYESERVQWLPWDSVRDEIRADHVQDGMSLTALLWVLSGMHLTR